MCRRKSRHTRGISAKVLSQRPRPSTKAPRLSDLRQDFQNLNEKTHFLTFPLCLIRPIHFQRSMHACLFPGPCRLPPLPFSGSLGTVKRPGSCTFRTRRSNKNGFAANGSTGLVLIFILPLPPPLFPSAGLKRWGRNPARVRKFWIVFGLWNPSPKLLLRWKTRTRAFCGSV